MSLVSQVNALATAIATELNTVRTERGTLISLTTTNKASIVAAINEIAASVSTAAQVNDLATAVGTTWSSQKVTDEIAAAITNILGGATAAADTLSELETLINSGDSAVTGLLTTVSQRVSTQAAQGLTTLEKTNARANIDVVSSADIGNTATNFTTTFTTALT